MALITLEPGGGLYYPSYGYPGNTGIIASTKILDLTDEKLAMIGYANIQDRGTSKVISAAGGGSISFVASSVTFADGGTSLDIGIVGVHTTSGPPAQPSSATLDVKATFVGGTDTINNGTWTTAAMETGTKTISHGDLIAIVFDMTARAGSDTVSLLSNNVFASVFPITNHFVASAWGSGTENIPVGVQINFDDGTLGNLDGMLCGYPTVDSFTDSTNPDERGNVFRVPFSCYVDGIWYVGGGNGATRDFDLKLYQGQTSPSLLESVVVLGEQLGVTTYVPMFAPFNSQVQLSTGTDYVVTMKATGTGNAVLYYETLLDADSRALRPGGTNVFSVNRNDSTGNFTTDSTSKCYLIGVRISQISDGAGGGRSPFTSMLQPIGSGI